MFGLGDFKLADVAGTGYSGLLNTIDNSVGLSNGGFSSGLSGIGNTLSSVGSTIGSGLNALGDYKDAINVGAGLFNAYSNYQSASAMQDYYKAIMAEQARQVDKEQQATADQQSGFSGSALYNPNKETSNYYSV